MQYSLYSAKDILEEFLAAPPPHNYPTGFPRLDEVLGGGLQEGIYLVGATPGRGKTTFALQIADYIAAHQTNTYVLYFALDMDRSDLLARSISRITFINSDTLPNSPKLTADRISEHWRDLEPDERKAFDTARAEHYATSAQRMYYPKKKHYTAEDISKYVVNFIKKIACDIPPVVIIDYAQYIRPADLRVSDGYKMCDTMFTLRMLSREYKIPLLVISALNEKAYETEDVTLSMFDGGEWLIGAAGVVLSLQPTASSVNSADIRELDLCILKNNFGREGDKIRLKYAAAYNYFEEV